MKDNWFNHNTDKLLLSVLVVLLIVLNVHLAHHDGTNMQTITWAHDAFNTVLGALILILTGRINRADRADGQTTNGIPPHSPETPPVITPVVGADPQ